MKNFKNNYRKYFDTILEQDIPADQATIDDEENALKQGLEPETDPSDFDVEPVEPNVQSKVLSKLNEYIVKIEEFSAFLNDPENSSSLNNFLNEADKEGSIIQGISRESNKVTTVAESLAGLAEAFRGQLMVAKRKHRERQSTIEEY